MGSSPSFSLALALAAVVLMQYCMAHLADAQNTSTVWLNLHNAARRRVKVGPVSWDDDVAAYAQWYANQRIRDCQLKNSGGPFGENIFGGLGRDWSAMDAVKAWVGEEQYYNCFSNTCDSGKVCGHYTQVVWASSWKIGCARVKCHNGGIFITCNYSPPGNVVGQRPYPCRRNGIPFATGELSTSE